MPVYPSEEILLNSSRVDELRQENLVAGLDLISAHLNKRIILPSEQRHWPDVAMIRRANAFRQIILAE